MVIEKEYLLALGATAVACFAAGWMANTALAPQKQANIEKEDEDDEEWEDVDDEDDEDEDDSGSDEDESEAIETLIADGGESVLLKGERDEECKLVILVRTDLKMQKGKIAAQCGHATLGCYKVARRHQPKVLRQWEAFGQAKVALKVTTDEELEKIMVNARNAGLIAVPIRDAGRTQIAAGSRTVLGIGPAPKSVIDKYTNHLKLL
eukprot:m.192945 g.192945  ORF g.192945 m.192945 type:complete len:207 (+) comp32488_c4_seq3:89-709(+)